MMTDSAFLISLVAVIIATASTAISYLLLREARDPNVIVYATPDELRPSVVNLVIENIGRGVAWDVTFASSTVIPQKAFGFDDAKDPEQMDCGPIVTGIPCFGPGSKRVLTWGQYGGIFKGIGEGTIDVTATYFSRPAFALFKRKHETLSRLDIKSFEHTNNSDHNWDKKMAEELKKIATEIKRMRSVPENALRILPVEKHKNENDT